MASQLFTYLYHGHWVRNNFIFLHINFIVIFFRLTRFIRLSNSCIALPPPCELDLQVHSNQIGIWNHQIYGSAEPELINKTRWLTAAVQYKYITKQIKVWYNRYQSLIKSYIDHSVRTIGLSRELNRWKYT